MMDPSLCGYKKMNVTTTYVHAVQKAGGLPIIIPCICSEEEMKQYIELCDGFVLIGGMDIAPVLYGEMPHAKCGAYDYDVDVSQLAFTKLVIESEKTGTGDLSRNAAGQYRFRRYFDSGYSFFKSGNQSCL